MKKMLIFLTVVTTLAGSSLCYATGSGEDLFFSLKASLWYQGIEQDPFQASDGLILGEKSVEHIENKDKSSGLQVPEELSIALKNL